MRIASWLPLVLPFLTTSLASSPSVETPKLWHKALAGIPLTHSPSLSPKFHRRQEFRRTESYIYVATQANSLAALEPANGTIAWRHVYEPFDTIVNYKPYGIWIGSLSGPGGATFRLAEARSGHLLLELPLHNPGFGKLNAPVDGGTDIQFLNRNRNHDILVLTNSNTVQRISMEGGFVMWNYNAATEGSPNLFSHILFSDEEYMAYIIGITKSFKSYTLRLHTIDLISGSEHKAISVPSSIRSGFKDIIAFQQSSNPCVVWLEDNGAIKYRSLLGDSTITVEDRGFKRIIDVGLTEQGAFVAIRDDETALVLHVPDKHDAERPKIIFEFTDSAPNEKQSPSEYAGGLDKENKPYVARVYYSFNTGSMAMNLYIPHSVEGAGQVTGLLLPYNTTKHGIVNHVALDVAPLGDDKYLTRPVFTTSVGSVLLYHGADIQWVREESLTKLDAVEFVDLPEKGIVRRQYQSEIHKAAGLFVGVVVDVVEGIADVLRKIQTELVELAGAFLSGKPRGTPKGTPNHFHVLNPPPLTPEPLFRDKFGIHKVIVAVSSTGKAFGLHSGNGAILWSRILGLESGRLLRDFKVRVVSSVLDGSEVPAVAVVANFLEGKGTTVIHLNALTGDVIPSARVPAHFGKHYTSEVFLLQNTNRSLLFIDSDRKLGAYHHNGIPSLGVHTNFTESYFTRITGRPHKTRFEGYKIPTFPIASLVNVQPQDVWAINLGPTESIMYTFNPPNDPVASFGKVLADRTAMYKYLNQHVVGLVTFDTGAPGSNALPKSSIYLVDSVTGVVLYHASVSTRSPVVASMSENWLVWTYRVDDLVGADGDGDGKVVVGTKGQHIVSVEFYEWKDAKGKTRSSELSSFSPDITNFKTFQQGFLLAHGVKTMTMSSTKFGISSKDLIVTTPEGQVQTIPRRMLDPRRHKNKPSAADGEELLMPYEPLIPDDHQRVLSQEYEVAGVQKIITSPALLESTSLVLAYGQDFFLTRVSPSGTFDVLSDSFNKVQLVLTVLGLSVAIFVVKPIVQRRHLNQQWY